MKFRSTKVLSAKEAEQANSQVSNLVTKAEERDSSEDIQQNQNESQEQSQPLSLPSQKKNQNQNQPRSYPNLTYLGTSHLEPYLMSLNNQLTSLENLILHVQREKGHVPHLGSVMRSAKSLYRMNIRAARLVGRLYESLGWDYKYVHAGNSEALRAFKAQGGYEGLANHPRVAAEIAGRIHSRYWQ